MQIVNYVNNRRILIQPPEKKKSYRELREEELAKERAAKAAKEAEEVGYECQSCGGDRQQLAIRPKSAIYSNLTKWMPLINKHLSVCESFRLSILWLFVEWLAATKP